MASEIQTQILKLLQARYLRSDSDCSKKSGHIALFIYWSTGCELLLLLIQYEFSVVPYRQICRFI